MRERTPEQKAKHAEYSRQWRERRRAAAQAAIASAQKPAEQLGPVAAALEASLKAMRWIEASDAAMVAIAQLQARQVDALMALGTSDGAGLAIRYSVALSRSLSELAGTPRVRMTYELRSRRVQAAAAEEAAAAAPNVTSISARPPKRRPQER